MGASGTPPGLLSVDATLDVGALRLVLRLASTARRLAICGPSGAGKSSALRVLAGLEPRALGRVTVLGETWQETARAAWLPSWRRGVGWVPQEAYLLPHRSVRENLCWGLPEGPGSNQAVADVAARLEIAALLQRRPRHLSGGERQRVALGRALLRRPRLLLLDEPLSALDRDHRARVAQVVDAFAREHDLPLVLVSHDERDVASLADEVWQMDEGQLRRLTAGPS